MLVRLQNVDRHQWVEVATPVPDQFVIVGGNAGGSYELARADDGILTYFRQARSSRPAWVERHLAKYRQPLSAPPAPNTTPRPLTQHPMAVSARDSQLALVQGAIPTEASAIIRDGSGRILLWRRRRSGAWGLPARVKERGETVVDALRREVRKETGLRIIRTTPFSIYSDPAYSVTHPNGNQVQLVTLAFLIEEWDGEPIADGDETRELAFFAPGTLPPDDQIHPPHRKTLLDFQRFLADGAFIVD